MRVIPTSMVGVHVTVAAISAIATAVCKTRDR
jgi:hypothetical protein